MRSRFEFIGYDQADLPVEIQAEIVYVDREGMRSERRITTRSLAQVEGKGWYIHAHCHLEGASRTFRADRILQFIDLSSGEIISDSALYLRQLYERSPAGMMAKAVDQIGDEFSALIFVARADGRVTKADYGAIGEYMRRRLPHLVIDDQLLKEYVLGSREDQNGYRRKIRSLSKSLDVATQSELLSVLGQIAARRKSAPFGQAAVDLARSAFSKK